MTSAVTVRTGLRPTRIEVDLAAVRANVHRFGRLTGTRVCAVVKADGYGHGGVPVARAALAGGAEWLAVALVEEGVALREAGIDAPVLLLSEPPVSAVEEVLAAGLTPCAYRGEFLAALDRAGRARGRPVDVHLKVDTGMGRVGATEPEWSELFAQAASAGGVRIRAVWTHLARADEPDVATTDRQLDALDRAVASARGHGLRPGLVHAANSAGALLHVRSHRDLVRPGIGIYGLSPAQDVDAADHGLRPALRLVSEVSFVKRVAAGTPLSYGHRWQAPAQGWVATLPIGYADGLPRALGNRAEVLHDGRRRPLVGTVTMDQALVWCGGQQPRVGDEVVLLGAQGDDRVKVEEWAETCRTITYEIVTQLSARLPRHHVDAGASGRSGRA